MACLASRIVRRGNAGRPCLIQSASRRSLVQLSGLTNSTSSSSNFVEETALRLKELGVSPSDIINNPHASRLPFNVIEHRLHYCAEGGIKTCMESVINFDSIVKSNIPVIKDAKLMASDVNVVESLLASINFDGPYPSHVNPNGVFQLVHFQTLTHCMQYSFGYSFPLWSRYLHACLKFSLYNIEHFHKLGLGWRWIRNHPSLICFANPFNLTKLREVENMYELPINLGNLLRRDPNIAFIDYEDFMAIFFILMKKQICKHDLINTKETEHFLVDPDVLDAQFKKVIVPRNAVDINLLTLLYKFKYLTETPKDKSWDNLQHFISKRKNPFIKAPEVSPGSWRHEMNQWLAKKKMQLEFKPCRHEPYNLSDEVDDAVEYDEDIEKEKGLSGKKRGRLARFLALSLHLRQEFVTNELDRVPLGSKTPTLRATKTLKFLQESGFKIEEIGQVVQLLIYPRNDVRKALMLVLSHKKYGSSNYRSRHLHLCLYHVLIKHNYGIYQPS